MVSVLVEVFWFFRGRPRFRTSVDFDRLRLVFAPLFFLLSSSSLLSLNADFSVTGCRLRRVAGGFLFKAFSTFTLSKKKKSLWLWLCIFPTELVNFIKSKHNFLTVELISALNHMLNLYACAINGFDLNTARG